MPRAIWTGSVSFGLLQIPVQLFSGERSVDLHFRLLDNRDQKPIRYERINSETGEEVPWKEVVKAFEYSKGSYAVVDEKMLKSAAPEATQTVEIEAFVDARSIHPMYFEKPYFLVPQKRAEKGYVLLRETLRETGKVGVARVVIRTRQYLALMMPVEDALVLNLLRYPQELAQADEFALPDKGLKTYRIAPKELEMAAQLVNSMSTKWDPADYKDEFRAKLRKLVEAQVRGKGGKRKLAAETEAEPQRTNVVDFMSVLRKSLETKGKGDGKDGGRKAKASTSAHPRRRRAKG